MAVKHLSDGNPDGLVVGQDSSDKLGFFGTTPITRRAITAVATGTATTTLNERKIDRLYVALRAYGIITTGG